MPKKPYPSQTAPTPPKRPKRIGDGSKMPKPAQVKPAKQVAMGIMGSTAVQAKARQQQALDDMRKRQMLRKKQG
jgi:hypothetical protein